MHGDKLGPFQLRLGRLYERDADSFLHFQSGSWETTKVWGHSKLLQKFMVMVAGNFEMGD